MNWRTPIAACVVMLLALQVSAQEEYPDTITLISGESQAVRLEKVRSKGKKIDFYRAGDPKLKTVKASSVDTLIIAADKPYYEALEYFDYGRSAWTADGSERYKEADSRDLNRRMDAWLKYPVSYPNEFSPEDDFEAGVLRGNGSLRINVSTYLNYDLVLQTFGNNYTWQISGLELSTGETLSEYIRQSCYKADGSMRPNVPAYNKSVIAKSGEALKEVSAALDKVLSEGTDN